VEALRRWRFWVSPMATNAAIATLLVAAMRLVGVRSFLLVHVPIVLLAASIGVWLFSIRHQLIPFRQLCTLQRAATRRRTGDDCRG
jgi:hypothetical protein